MVMHKSESELGGFGDSDDGTSTVRGGRPASVISDRYSDYSDTFAQYPSKPDTYENEPYWRPYDREESVDSRYAEGQRRRQKGHHRRPQDQQYYRDERTKPERARRESAPKRPGRASKNTQTKSEFTRTTRPLWENLPPLGVLNCIDSLFDVTGCDDRMEEALFGARTRVRDLCERYSGTNLRRGQTPLGPERFAEKCRSSVDTFLRGLGDPKHLRSIEEKPRDWLCGLADTLMSTEADYDGPRRFDGTSAAISGLMNAMVELKAQATEEASRRGQAYEDVSDADSATSHTESDRSNSRYSRYSSDTIEAMEAELDYLRRQNAQYRAERRRYER